MAVSKSCGVLIVAVLMIAALLFGSILELLILEILMSACDQVAVYVVLACFSCD